VLLDVVKLPKRGRDESDTQQIMAFAGGPAVQLLLSRRLHARMPPTQPAAPALVRRALGRS